MELFIIIIAILFTFWSLFKAMRKLATRYLINEGASILTTQDMELEKQDDIFKSRFEANRQYLS